MMHATETYYLDKLAALERVRAEIDKMLTSHRMNLEDEGILLDPELVAVNKACIAVLGRARRAIESGETASTGPKNGGGAV